MSWRLTLCTRTYPSPLLAANIWESTTPRKVTPKPILKPATSEGSIAGKTIIRKS
jgi:hypothetical protein